MSRSDSLRQPELRPQPGVPQPRENRVQHVHRGRVVRLTPDEMRVLETVGEFRTVAIGDLHEARINRLLAVRLLRRHEYFQGDKEGQIPIVTLTKKACELLDESREEGDAQRFWSGRVKPREI